MHGDSAGRPISPLSAGLRCRCPRCGRGKLFDGLLAVAERCQVCGLDLTPHDTGDGPAVFVIFILGALVAPAAIGLEVWLQPPGWVHFVVWLPVIAVLAVALLRPMKATMVALHYRNRRDEYDRGG